jgi:hypothetical protein
MIKEKNEKENVLIDLELVNMKNVSLLQYKEIRIKTTEAKKKKLLEEKIYIRGICSMCKRS